MTLAEIEELDEGFRLFTEETFKGNGRTCATCHIPEAFYTIGPRDIRKLRGDARKQVFASNVPDLEDPDLVRKLALFNTAEEAHADESDARFRGSMAIAAMNLTSLFAVPSPPAPPPGLFLPDEFGWGGDGSPRGGMNHGNPDSQADGTFRAFAGGAVAQHNPLTMHRKAGVDFRLPTDDEADALEAFQRWLGRRRAPGTSPLLGSRGEFDLDKMTFKHKRIAHGKTLYVSNEASCQFCHDEGGAHLGVAPVPGANGANDTDIDVAMAQKGIVLPEDLGAPGGGLDGIRGDFNIQSLIEAPRKHAFFHNSLVVTHLEDAIKTYFQPPFTRTGGPGTGSEGREGLDLFGVTEHADSVKEFQEFGGKYAIEEMGAFMRALSAWYALRDCERLVDETCERIDLGASTKLPILHIRFNLKGVTQVLDQAKIWPQAHGNVAYLAWAFRFGEYFEWAAKCRHKPTLLQLKKILGHMRRSIATTPDLE